MQKPTAIERAEALAKAANDRQLERLAARQEAAKRNRERYPEFARILDAMNKTFTINGKTYPGGLMAKIVEIEDL